MEGDRSGERTGRNESCFLLDRDDEASSRTVVVVTKRIRGEMSSRSRSRSNRVEEDRTNTDARQVVMDGAGILGKWAGEKHNIVIVSRTGGRQGSASETRAGWNCRSARVNHASLVRRVRVRLVRRIPLSQKRIVASRSSGKRGRRRMRSLGGSWERAEGRGEVKSGRG